MEQHYCTRTHHYEWFTCISGSMGYCYGCHRTHYF